MKAFPLARERIPNLRMLLVGGPRLEASALDPVVGVEVRGYIMDLHEHFVASDLVITQGGGTSTSELTALRRPFLYFPIEGHFEQQFHVARRLERHGAGVRMRFARTTPQQVAEQIVAHLGEVVTYAPIPVQGARRMAEVAVELLGEAGSHRVIATDPR